MAVSEPAGRSISRWQWRAETFLQMQFLTEMITHNQPAAKKLHIKCTNLTHSVFFFQLLPNCIVIPDDIIENYQVVLGHL